MIVYHRTHHADAIEREGFRDGEAPYMTDRLWRGVWVSAGWPVDESMGAHGDVVLALEIPDALFAEFEWVEEEKFDREALIPAARLKPHLSGLRRLSDDEIDELLLTRALLSEQLVRERETGG